MGGCVSALCERQKRENDIDNNINFSEGSHNSKEPGSPRRTKKKKTVIPKNVVIDDDDDDDEDLSITVHISDSTSLKQLRDKYSK